MIHEDDDFGLALTYLIDLLPRGATKVLAEKLDCTPGYITRLKKSENLPHRSKMAILCSLFGLSVEQMFTLGSAIRLQQDIAQEVISRMTSHQVGAEFKNPSHSLLKISPGQLAGELVGIAWKRGQDFELKLLAPVGEDDGLILRRTRKAEGEK